MGKLYDQFIRTKQLHRRLPENKKKLKEEVTEKEEKKIFWYWFTREGLAGTS
jgi:hypothetical protein